MRPRPCNRYLLFLSLRRPDRAVSYLQGLDDAFLTVSAGIPMSRKWFYRLAVTAFTLSILSGKLFLIPFILFAIYLYQD
jgi:hypothetical protein